MAYTLSEVEKLEEQLQRREHHLAELIDEVVYAEREKKEAEEASQMNSALNKKIEHLLKYLLQFQITLVGEIILPSLLDNQDEEGVAVLSHEGVRHALEQLRCDPSLSKETRHLVSKVLSQSLGKSPYATATIGLTDVQKGMSRSVLLSQMLLGRQRELLSSLDDMRNVCAMRGSSATGPGQIPSGDVRSPSRPTIFDVQDELAEVQRERDELRQQLIDAGRADETIRSLQIDKRQLEQEVVHAQRQTLKAQEANKELMQRIADLEDATARQEVMVRARESAANNSEKERLLNQVTALREELHRVTQDAQQARLLMESEVDRLARENRSLQRDSRKTMQLVATESGAQGKIVKLEGIVSALKTDLQIMESRVASIRDQREVERRRILTMSQTEKDRLRREKDECQVLLQRMSSELKSIEQENKTAKGQAALDDL